MKKTALYLVHGIGDQKPFETMDALLQIFIPAYEKELQLIYPSVTVKKIHHPVRFGDWSESCVSIIPSREDLPSIDIYEYYWAHLAERQIEAKQVASWIVDVARGARKFYDKLDQQSLEKDSNDQLFAKDGEFLPYKYFAHILSMGGILAFLGRFLSGLLNHSRAFGFFYSLLSALPILRKWTAEPLEKFLGDVTLYCSTDKRSRYYEVRQKILGGSLEKARFILGRGYDEIFFVGHSLGSVVAYDTLARLSRDMNLEPDLRAQGMRVKGLVTFGSPLDKIAFFFDEQIAREQIYRSAIISQLYGFRRVLVDERGLQSGFHPYFESLKWLNFWCPTDPVSGHLDVYRGVINYQMNFSNEIRKGIEGGLDSHGAYWKSGLMLQTILREFKLCQSEKSQHPVYFGASSGSL